jgi:hypothetical protein
LSTDERISPCPITKEYAVSDRADRPLVEFIDHARTKGMDHATIRMLLLAEGWKEKDIARAMAEHGLDLPTPAPPDVGGAREAFLHLVMFAALYTAVISAISLVFSLINAALPDAAATLYAGPSPEQRRMEIRWGIAALVVSFPPLIWLARLLLQESRRAPDRVRSPIRRWLTYLTLFVAAIAVGVDVMTLVYQLLGGDITLRFLLKVATVLILAGGAFAYYFASLRLPPEALHRTPLHRVFGWGAAACAGAIVVAGLVAVGTPMEEREAQIDARRLEDLRAIHDAVMRISFGDGWKDPAVPVAQVRPLPPTLGAVARDAVAVRPRLTDPETDTLYAYQIAGPTTFRLCAAFKTTRDGAKDPEWNHPAGLHCYEFDGMKPRR